MKPKVFLRLYQLPIVASALSLAVSSIVLSCSKDKLNKTDGTAEKVAPSTRKEMLNIVQVSEKSKNSLKTLLGSKFFLSEGPESSTESQVKVSVEVLDQVSKVSMEQTTESAVNDPTAQSLACTETKFVGEGLSVFSAALKSSDAPLEEKDAVPVLQEVAKDLIDTSKQESCQNAVFIPQPSKVELPPQTESSGLLLTDNSDQDVSSVEPSEIATSPKEEVTFDPSLSKPFQTAVSDYVGALSAEISTKDLSFVLEIKNALIVLSSDKMKSADLEKACGYISALRIPIVASLNHPEISEKAYAVLNNTVCK